MYDALGTGKRMGAAPILILITVLIIISLFIYGLVPGLYVNQLSAAYLMSANTESLANHGLFNFSYCKNYGFELGYPFLMGLPYIYLAAFLRSMLDLTPHTANVLAGSVFCVLAFYFCYKLLCRLGSNKYVAALLTFVYLTSHINYGQSGYHYMMYGFILLPAYIYIDIRLLDSIFTNPKIPWHLILSIIAFKSFALFMDGYSFVISSVASLTLLLFYNINNRGKKSKIAVATFFLGAGYVTAVLLYRYYVPAGANYAQMPIDYFRAQSVDVFSLFAPGSDLLLANALRISTTWNAATYYGDRSNVMFNYLGYSLLGLAIFSVVFIKKHPYQLKALMIAGSIAFALSLGPSLKVNDRKPAAVKATFTKEDYMMKKSDASFDLHTDLIYQKAPGVKMMRAVHRWLLLFKLVIIILAAITLTSFLAQKRILLTSLMLLIILIELSPDMFELHKRYRNYFRQMKLFETTVLPEIRDAISNNNRIVFISNENDFLGNYISATLGSTAYNCGGDKNQELARDSWPESIKNLTRYKDINSNSYTALSNRTVDVVVLPHFNLRWDSYNWPPRDKQANLDKFQNLIDFEDSRLKFKEMEWFTLITLSSNTAETL